MLLERVAGAVRRASGTGECAAQAAGRERAVPHRHQHEGRGPLSSFSCALAVCLGESRPLPLERSADSSSWLAHKRLHPRAHYHQHSIDIET